MKVEERTFRMLEVSFCLMAMIILVLLCIVVYFINLRFNPYDVNRDGRVDYTDVEELRNLLEGVDNGESNV